jgi:biopolymer transport protein TolR
MNPAMQPHGSVRKRRRHRGFKPQAEINVTPMVDVMLVLLVVFMVTAPLLTVGVPVELPQSEAEALNEPDQPVVVSVNAAGEVFVQETAIAIEGLVPLLQGITNNNDETRIYVRGDEAINYGTVMQVMGLISSAGFTKVALVTKLPEKAAEGDAGQ